MTGSDQLEVMVLGDGVVLETETGWRMYFDEAGALEVSHAILRAVWELREGESP